MLSTLSVNGLGLFDTTARWDFGNMTCIVGPNATGKTTLLNLVRDLLDNRSAGRCHVPPALAAGSLVISGMFHSPGVETSALTYRREFALSAEGMRRASKAWINDQPFAGAAEVAVGHTVISVDADLLQSRDIDFIARMYSGLAGDTTATKSGQIANLKQIINRHGPKLETDWGRVDIEGGRVVLRSADGQVVPPQLWSRSSRDNAMLQLALSVALEVATARPAIVLLDTPFGVMDRSLAEQLGKKISSLAGPNLQLLLTTWDDSLPELMRADAIVRMSRPNDNIGGLVAVSSQRPKHAVTVAQEAIESYGIGREDLFIDGVLRPGLLAMGCHRVSRVRNHGPGEYGLDIGPFFRPGPFGRRIMAGVQAKAGDLHCRAGKRKQSVEPLIDEIVKALNHRFVDKETNYYRKLDYVIAAVSGRLTDEARGRFYDQFQDEQRVILWESHDLAELFWNHSFVVLPCNPPSD